MKPVAFLVSFFAGYLAFACPDFSGTYHKVTQPDDSRSTIIWKIKQNGCNSYDNETQVVYKDGTKSEKTQFSRNINGVTEYWDGLKLMDYQKDVTSESCSIRGFLEQDQKKNLRYSWRFECPAPLGNSEWFTPETKNGWSGELYLRQ